MWKTVKSETFPLLVLHIFPLTWQRLRIFLKCYDTEFTFWEILFPWSGGDGSCISQNVYSIKFVVLNKIDMLHYQHFTNKQKYLCKMLRCEEGRYGENIHGRKQEQKTSISVLTQFFANIAKN